MAAQIIAFPRCVRLARRLRLLMRFCHREPRQHKRGGKA
jgi:hypothetical protein